MNILYIANARIPTEKAHGIQIMKMCEAFSDLGNEVELVIPRRINKIKKDSFEYYKVRKNFKITKLPCLDLIVLDKYIGHLGLWLESATFYISVLLYLLFNSNNSNNSNRSNIIYTRDKLFLPFSFLKKNLVFEAHAFPKNYFLYSLFIKKLNKIIVITRQLKSLLIEKGIVADKILVAPDGVDLKMFECSNVRMFEAREKLGLPQDRRIVLYTGHLYEWKGVQVLAEASQYLPENTEVYFVGGTKEDIRKFKVRCSKFKNVRIVGHRPHSEIPYWLKAADVLVLPNSGKEEISKKWTSPLKAFEYMASKKPIVASDLPSIKEILNGENAFLVEADNPRDLAEGIRKILENEQLATVIAEKAFEDVHQYSWAKRAEKILNFISSRS